MDFKYLKKLKANLKIGGEKLEGVKETDILKVEKDFKIEFPKAYREFLLLAGEYSGRLLLMGGNNDLKTLSKKSYLEILERQMKDNNVRIERSFWVFSEMDDFDQFYFFYLDENTDNPTVHVVTYRDGSGSYIESTEMTFSDFIDDIIDKSIAFSKRDF